MDSEQSSLSRTIGVNNNGGCHTFGMNPSRYYSQKHSHHIDWNSSRQVPVDMEKLLESQHSNNTAAIMMNSHRQTPPHQRIASFGTTTNMATNVNGGGTFGSNGTGTTITLHDYQNDVNENGKYFLIFLNVLLVELLIFFY